jgi:hypothetical protein
MTLKRETAKALSAASLGFLLVGLMVGAPAGRFFLVILAGLFALVPALFYEGRIRFVAAAMLGISLFAAYVIFPEYTAEMKTYREHSQGRTPVEQTK